MKPLLNSSLSDESCLFEANSFSADFEFVRKSRVIFRVLSPAALRAEDCVFKVNYLSIERNVLREQTAAGEVSNVSLINPNSTASRVFGLSTANTVYLMLDNVPGAESITLTFAQNGGSPIFVRRDTVRVEQIDKKMSVVPYSVLLNISATSQPRYLLHADPGRHVFTSRSCIGVKGLIFSMRALDGYGQNTSGDVGLVARLASLDAGAIAIPRARRLERPERFNKEINIPAKASFLSGSISPIAESGEFFYDIMGLKISQFRHAVGIPTGVALFEQTSLKIHEDALSRSREEFLALMQGD